MTLSSSSQRCSVELRCSHKAGNTELSTNTYWRVCKLLDFSHDFLSFGFFSWRPKCDTTNHMRTFSPLIGRMCSEQEQHCSGLVNNMEQLFLTYTWLQQDRLEIGSRFHHKPVARSSNGLVVVISVLTHVRLLCSHLHQSTTLKRKMNQLCILKLNSWLLEFLHQCQWDSVKCENSNVVDVVLTHS